MANIVYKAGREILTESMDLVKGNHIKRGTAPSFPSKSDSKPAAFEGSFSSPGIETPDANKEPVNHGLDQHPHNIPNQTSGLAISREQKVCGSRPTLKAQIIHDNETAKRNNVSNEPDLDIANITGMQATPHETNGILKDILAKLGEAVKIEKKLDHKSTRLAFYSLLVSVLVSASIAGAAWWQNAQINAPGIPQVKVGLKSIIAKWVESNDDSLSESLQSGSSTLTELSLGQVTFRPVVLGNSGIISFIPKTIHDSKNRKDKNVLNTSGITPKAIADWIKLNGVAIGIRYPTARKDTISDIDKLSELKFAVWATCKDEKGTNPIIEFDLSTYGKATLWGDDSTQKDYYGDYLIFDDKDLTAEFDVYCPSKIETISFSTKIELKQAAR